jgi:DNA-binding NtrC family response regulator
MSPSLNSEIVSLSEVPEQDWTDTPDGDPVVLVVDDEPLVADTLSIILSRAGFRTMTAYDAKTALSMAGATPPSLLISDVAMPEMNGVELAIVLLETQPKCKVLLFSGHATSADLVSAMDAGHDFRLLAKPVHPTEMIRLVSKSLSVRPRNTQPIRHAEVVPIRRSA